MPATITAFAIGGPVGLVALAATIGAFKHGSQLDAQAKIEDEDAAAEARRSLPATQRATTSPLDAWDAECEALWQMRDDELITEEEFDRRYDELAERWTI